VKIIFNLQKKFKTTKQNQLIYKIRINYWIKNKYNKTVSLNKNNKLNKLDNKIFKACKKKHRLNKT
jgi:hypothetical protein